MKDVYSLLSRTADGALVTDGDCRVKYWNPAAERMLGFSSKEVVGRPCHEVIRGHSLNGRPLCMPMCPVSVRLQRGEGVRNFDIHTTTKSGERVWLNVSSIPVPSGKNRQYVVVHLFHEVTKLAKLRRLTEALYGMVGGTIPFSPSFKTEKDPNPEIQSERLSSLPLTNREREIVKGLAEGLTTHMLADRLCISPATVRNHIQHILGKLGAHSRLEILAMAFGPRSG